jgi:hypothetical protein
MEPKRIFIAPITDAIIPSGVVDQPSVCGAFNSITMKMIEDLGHLFATPTSKQSYRIAIWECPYCQKHFDAAIARNNYIIENNLIEYKLNEIK